MVQRVLKLADGLRDRAIDFYVAGEPVIRITDVEQSREIALRLPLTFLIIALMLLLSFRNLQGMAIPMLTAALSTTWGLGFMGHTGLVIDTWNAATPILIVAIAAGHSAQMLKRYIEEVERLGDNRAAVVASTTAVGPVMIAAGGVAALGFAALALDRHSGDHRFRPRVCLRHRQRGGAGDDLRAGVALAPAGAESARAERRSHAMAPGRLGARHPRIAVAARC